MHCIMGRRNQHLDNPLQYLRNVLGLNQQDFADLLKVDKNELARREISYRGYEVLPDDWHWKLSRFLGVMVLVNRNKKPGEPGYYREPVGWAGVPFTREYYDARYAEFGSFVKHPTADVLKALTIVGELAVRLKREDQFAEAFKLATKTLCASTRFKLELTRKAEQLVKAAKKEDRVAAKWLCDVLDDEKLHRRIPTLPTEVEYMRNVVAQLKKMCPKSRFFIGEKEVK